LETGISEEKEEADKREKLMIHMDKLQLENKMCYKSMAFLA
jgi:hypothetical protein